MKYFVVGLLSMVILMTAGGVAIYLEIKYLGATMLAIATLITFILRIEGTYAFWTRRLGYSKKRERSKYVQYIIMLAIWLGFVIYLFYHMMFVWDI